MEHVDIEYITPVEKIVYGLQESVSNFKLLS